MIAFSDQPAERAILAGLCQYGNNVYIDIADIINETTFTETSNGIIFRCLKHILDSNTDIYIDIATIQSIANELNLAETIQKETSYLKSLFCFSINKENVKIFAIKIRKLSIARELHHKLRLAQQKLENVLGTESITHILGIAEDAVFNFASSLDDQDNLPESLLGDVDDYIQYVIDNPVQQIGISTGFPIFDQAIGGGLRQATINIIASRSKGGKSILGDNIGYYIASKLNIPVLNLDTEMTKEDHICRTLAMIHKIPIQDIETGKFAQKEDWKQKIIESLNSLKNIPLYYRSIAGKQFEDQLAIIRRWLIKVVGLHQDGTAKDCVVIYDYLKLMDAQGISSDMKEYQLLGFMMTALHNFATKYKIPILAFIQLNRDGITKESTDTASGSDRIIWLCSNFTILKAKSNEELAEDGVQNGNRKLVPIIARHGAGLDVHDYINCHMDGWCAKIVEGKTKLELQSEDNDDGYIGPDDDNQIDFS